jgi:EmrB/QacA subfamily drug resistance transporter
MKMHDATAMPIPKLSRREMILIFAGLMMAMAMAALDQNIVSTALPRIVGELGGLSHLSWVVTAFMLTSTASTPLYGKLSDMYGRKPLFMLSISLFLVGSMVCGLAGSMTQLILFRGLQGIGAGGLMTLAQTTIGDIMEPRERSKYQGLFAGVFAVCSVVGPLVGGVITSALSWRWVFYINIPVGLAALLLIAIGLKRPNQRVRHRIDYGGAVLVVIATSTLLLMLSWGGSEYAWGSPEILGLLGATGAFGALLLVQERRAPEPMLPLGLFRNRVFLTGTMVGMLVMLSVFGAALFLPLYFQLVMGASPAKAGLLMAPQIGGLIIASVIGGQMLARNGRYRLFLASGMATVTVGFLALAVSAWYGLGLLMVEFSIVLTGMGMGLSMPTLTVTIQNAVPRSDLGVATSSMSFLRSLGGSLGVALAGGVMTARLKSLLPADMQRIGGRGSLDAGVDQIASLPAIDQLAVLGAYQHAIAATFIIGAIVGGLGFVVALLLPDTKLVSARTAEPAASGERAEA